MAHLKSRLITAASVIAYAVACMSLQVEAGCPRGLNGTTVMYNGYCYEFDTEVKTSWAVASSICILHAGTLVEIKDESTQEFIESVIQNYYNFSSDSNDVGFWTGLENEGSYGVWTWRSGDSANSYKNWAKGEPYRFWPTYKDEDQCAVMLLSNNWQWSNHPCNIDDYGDFYYICQYDQVTEDLTTTQVYHTSIPYHRNITITDNDIVNETTTITTAMVITTESPDQQVSGSTAMYAEAGIGTAGVILFVLILGVVIRHIIKKRKFQKQNARFRFENPNFHRSDYGTVASTHSDSHHSHGDYTLVADSVSVDYNSMLSDSALVLHKEESKIESSLTDKNKHVSPFSNI